MKISFQALVKRFQSMGEKTGWTFIDIPIKVAETINPGVKKAFRVSGKLNEAVFEQLALTPMGGGHFILAIKKELQKKGRINVGEIVEVEMMKDDRPLLINKQLLEVLKDEPDASSYFHSLAQSHQLYFSKWIDSSKTEATTTKRLAAILNALCRKWDYGQMIRNEKRDKDF